MTGLHAGKRYGEVAVGDEFTSAMTITEAHLTLGAGLIADFNPLHVNEAFARRSRYGSRILHGVITSAVLGGPVGMIFAGTALGYLEHNTRFLAPVRIGDTLTLRWTVTEKSRQARTQCRRRRAARRGDQPGRRDRRRSYRQNARRGVDTT